MTPLRTLLTSASRSCSWLAPAKGVAGSPAATDWQPRKHFPPLDGIRGIAILLVLIHHFGGVMSPSSRIDWMFMHVTGWAWVGVDLFFVLSGFLITGILLDSLQNPHYFKTFYARRALRVFPLYFAFLFALAFLILPAMRVLALHNVVSIGNEWLSNPVTHQPLIWLYLTNHLVAVHGFGALPAFTSVFWSLAVEEQFYLVWPTIVRWMPRQHLLWVACVAVLLAFGFRVWIHVSGIWSRDAAYVLTLARMDTLAVGAAIAMLVRVPQSILTIRRWLPLCALVSVASVLAVIVARGGLYSWDPAVQIIGFSATALTCGVLLASSVVARPRAALNRALSNGMLRAFGKYSYGIYILHAPVNWIGEHVYARYQPPAVLGSAIPGTVAYMVIGFSITFALAWVSWRYFESLFLALKRYFPVNRSLVLEAVAVSRDGAVGPASAKTVLPAFQNE